MCNADYDSDIEMRDVFKEMTPDIRVLSEERMAVDYDERRIWNNYWLNTPNPVSHKWGGPLNIVHCVEPRIP